jgi:peptide chain release factor 1
VFDQFEDLQLKFSELERRMSDPEIISDQKAYQELVKKHSGLKPAVDLYLTCKTLNSNIEEAQELLQDPEMKEMAEEELAILLKEKKILEHSMELFLIPKDPNDDKDAIVEIRSGTGGEEAALFASELYRMYTRYSDANQWKTEVMSQNITGLGGIKEIVFSIKGTHVYSRLKYESGTHRVQRVPDTETSGRVHTSAATVAILPEAEEVDVSIDPKDLKIDTFRASGAGGQHVNKTDSAVRITHLTSGIVVACQDERSQFQNKEKAMRVLRTRLYEKTLADQAQKEAANRKIQVGTGDRSQKIRTYNYPQNRVTDHRINLTLYDLSGVLEGKLDSIVDPLTAADQMEKLKQ